MCTQKTLEEDCCQGYNVKDGKAREVKWKKVKGKEKPFF